MKSKKKKKNDKGLDLEGKKSFSCCNIPRSPSSSPPLPPPQNSSHSLGQVTGRIAVREGKGNQTDHMNCWETFVLRGPNQCSVGPLGIFQHLHQPQVH